MSTPLPLSARKPLPPAPDSNAEGDFESLADTFLSEMEPHRQRLEAVADNVYANAVAAGASASIAAQQAALAQQTVVQAQDLVDAAVSVSGAPMWVGVSLDAVPVYAKGTVVWSPTDGRLYRAKVMTGGGPDPAVDSENWFKLSASSTPPVFAIDVSTAIPAGIRSATFLLTAPNINVALPSGSATSDTIRIIDRSGADAPGHTINRNGALLDGVADNIAWDIKNGDVTFLQTGNVDRGWLILSGRRS